MYRVYSPDNGSWVSSILFSEQKDVRYHISQLETKLVQKEAA